ncbi:hypothetical protein V6N13_093152 [Hibiscus sabdariffa]
MDYEIDFGGTNMRVVQWKWLQQGVQREHGVLDIESHNERGRLSVNFADSDAVTIGEAGNEAPMDPREVNWRGNKLWEEAIESNACPHDEYDVAETGAIENARVILVYGSGNVDTVDTIGPILLNVGSKVEWNRDSFGSIDSQIEATMVLLNELDGRFVEGDKEVVSMGEITWEVVAIITISGVDLVPKVVGLVASEGDQNTSFF